MIGRPTTQGVKKSEKKTVPANSHVAVRSDAGTNLPTGVPVKERRYVLPFVLVTELFFLWAIGVNLNDVLIHHLRRAFGLTDFRSC